MEMTLDNSFLFPWGDWSESSEELPTPLLSGYWRRFQVVEVRAQKGPLSDGQVPSLTDNPQLMGPKGLCILDLASDPYAVGGRIENP